MGARQRGPRVVGRVGGPESDVIVIFGSNIDVVKELRTERARMLGSIVVGPTEGILSAGKVLMSRCDCDCCSGGKTPIL